MTRARSISTQLAGTVTACALATTVAFAEPPAKRCCEIARARRYPVGAPKSSDVIMRSLRLHPTNKKDPHDTMQALKDFHVTRLEWAYIESKPFIEKVKASGRVFGGAAAAPSYHTARKEPGWFEKVVILDREGKPIIAPWKRTWNRTLWGCINNPELERGYIAYLKRYIDAGADVMQRDEPGANHNATRWGGCFCPHCMKAFRVYLARNTTPEQRAKLGVADVKTFDYAAHLRQKGAPVGDAFAKWKGGELKRLFGEFQMQASVDFHHRTRKAIDAYAGRRVPFSCNNGTRTWSPVQLCYDWVFGELSYGHARPEHLYQAMRKAAEHDRIQVVTMPKKGDTRDPDGWRRRTRQTIATAYASGGLCMVPWDVYMPRDAPRYFGSPTQYADLFGFVRASAAYLNGYEDAAVAGKGLKETRYGRTPPLEIGGGAGELRAFVRARPGKDTAPVVIHLIEWAAAGKSVKLTLRTERFFGRRPLAVKLLVPAPYDPAAHAKADQTKQYTSLSKTVDVPVKTDAGSTIVEVPALDPWGMLIVTPKG